MAKMPSHVHYVTDDGSHVWAHVVDAPQHSTGGVSLVAIINGNLTLINADYSKEPRPGTWHWPEPPTTPKGGA